MVMSLFILKKNEKTMIEIILAMIFSALFLYGCVGLGERLEKGKAE